MKKEKNIELEMAPVGPWFSDEDEAVFFQWLDKIKCVKKYEGHFCTLYIEVDPDLVDKNELREMIALFLRYDVDMKQLAVFDRPEFAGWLKKWQGSEAIFGDKRTTEVREKAKEEAIEFMHDLEKNRELKE